MEKEQIKEKIQKLVAKYEILKKEVKLKTYSEEDTKKDFILPLFEILGYDTSNKNEVSSEDHIKGSGRPDYNFKINGITQFYLEAKKISVDLDDEKFAFQAINYSWNKGITYAVLTDFEGIKVFNAQRIDKTELMDKLVFELSYDKYISDFETLWLLSKESFKEKELDSFAEKHGKKEKSIQVSTVIKKINEDIQWCRERLTQSFKGCNEKLNLSQELIDEGVQKLLDRLIFLRVAEDREVEQNILKDLLRQAENIKTYDLFQAMISTFRELDKIYDSNLFSEHAFEKWEVWDGGFEEVINKLYGKRGYYEYNFKEMPADVLGSVYENYLGYKLSTQSKDAKKRKEQGIYYTPPFIVDYIVRNTLKPVLDNCKSVNDLKNIKVLDPACGSGSFLIKALEAINEKYNEFGVDNHFLKRQIITENIYGVDLDIQAVEIARLNLSINSLDSKGELPKLDNNIKNGNSLISGTDEEMEKQFGKDRKDKKPFNWQEEFPEVFKQGGFGVIIGNPPYIFARGGNFDEKEKEYYSNNYKLSQYQANTFLLFIEQGYNLLKQDGFFGFIVPNNWLTINSFSKLREFLLKNVADLKIKNATKSIFDQASVDTCLLLFKKSLPTTVKIGELQGIENPTLSEYKSEDFFQNEFVINISKINTKNDSIEFKNTIPLGDITDVKSGLMAYEIGKGKPEQTEEMKNNRIYHSKEKDGKDWVKYLDGVDVGRYVLGWSGEYIKYGDNLAAKRNSELFEKERILVRQIPSKPPYCINAVFTEEKCVNDRNSNNILNPKEGYNLKYIIGIINSKLISYWFIQAFDKFQRKIFPQFKVNELARFPIYKVDEEKQKPIIILVDKITSLNKRLKEVSEHSNEWDNIKSEIEKTDKKIDKEVYKIYGLSEEEVMVIETSH